MKRWSFACTLLVLFLVPGNLSAAVASKNAAISRGMPATEQLPGPQRVAKYVFLFIGDGMSMPQRSAADYYCVSMNLPEAEKITNQKIRMNALPIQGMTSTHSINSVITDSAAAGTAIATGHKTLNGIVAMGVHKKTPITTIAEVAKENDMRVGIVTSVSLDHATPACFYAHEPSRNNYYSIAKQMIESRFDYFGGGYLLGNLPKNRGKQPDLIRYAKEKGWAIADSRESIRTMIRQGSIENAPPKVIAYADYDDQAAMDYKIDQTPDDVTLAEFTELGIKLLDNPNGFFFMIEGGKIDWACHVNDAATVIREVLDLDNAVGVALDFYMKHPNETLIIVTGDHETGGMTIGFAGTKYTSVPARVAAQKMSYKKFNEIVTRWRGEGVSFEDVLKVIEDTFGLTDLSENEKHQLRDAFERSMLPEKSRKNDDHAYELYGSDEPLTVKSTHLLARRAGLSWTTWSHTALPVVTSAVGVGSEAFGGYYDNTQLFPKMCEAMGL